jgi:hypothetical protein
VRASRKSADDAAEAAGKQAADGFRAADKEWVAGRAPIELNLEPIRPERDGRWNYSKKKPN